MEKVSLENIFDQQLKKTLLIVVIILFLILASILAVIYNYAYNNQKQQAETMINYFFTNAADTLTEVEADYNQELRRALLNFSKNYSTAQNQKYLNMQMKQIRNRFYKLDKKQDLQIREVNYYFLDKQGEVFKTDYQPDQGLDLTQLKGQWSKLQNLAVGEVLILPFETEVKTAQMRLYGYVKLPDGNYFELGLLFNNMKDLLAEEIEKINLYPDLEIQLFTAGFNPLFENELELAPEDKALLKEAQTKEELIVQEESFYRERYYQAWSLPYGNLYAVLNINHTSLQIIFNLIFILFVIIIIVIYLGREKLHQKLEDILAPIQKISQNMNDFKQVRVDEFEVDKPGISEIDNIIDNYLTMADEIRASYQQLEAYSEALEEKNKELAKSKKRVRKIIDLSPNHIFIKDWDGQYILINKTHAQFFSKEVEELQGKIDQDLGRLSSAKLDHLLKEDRKVIKEGKEYVFEDHIIDEEGEERVFEATKIPFEEDNETYMLAIARDITQQREAQNRIKEQKEELEASYQQLEAYNNEILELNENLEAAYQERDDLVKKLEKVIDLTSELTRGGLTNTKEFLSQLLHSAFEIIEEADYGTVFSLGDEHIEFIDTIGHDIEALNNLELKNKIFAFTPTEPEIIAKSKMMKVVRRKLTGQVRKDFLRATRPVKETIMFALVVDGERKAGFSLDIARRSENEFSQQSLDIVNAFNSLAISFYIMQSYSNIRSDFQSQIVSSLINLLEVHDQYTKGHSENVAELGTKVAFELGLSIEKINDVYWAGLMHDIGKTVVPAEILNKKTKLSDEEFEKIKKHPVWGYKALKDSEQLEEIAKYIYHHHERPDGSGYPKGLNKDEIPMISKILSVVDAWDAMRSSRSYREPLSKEKAIQELVNNRGEQFSAKVVDAFLKIIKEQNKTNSL